MEAAGLRSLILKVIKKVINLLVFEQFYLQLILYIRYTAAAGIGTVVYWTGSIQLAVFQMLTFKYVIANCKFRLYNIFYIFVLSLMPI